MKNVSQERLKELKRIKNWILLVTVNGIESDKVVLSMDYLDDENDILEVFHDKNTYHIGKFGAYNAVHVQSEMGAVGRNASITTTDHAIKLWKPRAIIMIGVGWGADETKQKIGDVMVSKVVTSFEPAKITQGKTIQRGVDSEPGSVLLDRLCKHMQWNYQHDLNGQMVNSNMFAGEILSGEKLLNDKKFKDELLTQYPEAVGGEMEGAGFATACKDNNLAEWIIVKGICDWGYNKQNENKEAYQIIAVLAAISLCKDVLSKKEVLESLMKTARPKLSLPFDDEFTGVLINNSRWKADTDIVTDDNGRAVLRWENYSLAEMVRFVRVTGRYFRIENIYSNKCLDVEGGQNEDSTRVQFYKKNRTMAQLWRIDIIDPNNSDGPLFVLEPKCAPGKVLDIGDEPDSQVVIWNRYNGNRERQIFRIWIVSPQDHIEKIC